MTSPGFYNELEGELSGTPEEAPLSVSDALLLARTALETLRLCVVGEVSGWNGKVYKAVYFDLVDGSSTLHCLMWRDRYEAGGVELQLGEQVELSGNFSLYSVKGDLQFVVESIEPVGEGRLRMEVARRVKALQAEGLMDGSRKRPLPLYPEHIALVTSPQGAAVQDVIRNLKQRWSVARISLFGVQVEGVGAVESIIAGLQAADAVGADEILLVRGGGSYENLMPFSEEAVARAVAACVTPVVTGIGHEPDTSIADLVADAHASTPTAAAVMVSPDIRVLRADLAQSARRLASGLSNRVERDEERLRHLRERPCLRDSRSLFAVQMQSVDLLAERLERAIPQRLQAAADQLTFQSARLDALSPLKVLARGYAYATLPATGAIVKSVTQVDVGDELALRLADGSLQATIRDKQKGDRW